MDPTSMVRWITAPRQPLNPSRKVDQKSLFCCGIADTVKTKFKVEPGDERYSEDRWYAWLKDDWVLYRRKRLFPTLRLMGKPTCFCSPAPFSALCDRKEGSDDARSVITRCVSLANSRACR